MRKIVIAVLLLFAVQSISAQQSFIGPDGKVGFKDENGEVIIPCQYSMAHSSGFKEGLCAVKKSSSPVALWGFIDTTGRLVIPYKFTSVYDGFSEGLCGVMYGLSLKHGYIDKSGKVVIRIEETAPILDPFVKGKAKIHFMYESRLITATIDRNIKKFSYEPPAFDKVAGDKKNSESSVTAEMVLAMLQGDKEKPKVEVPERKPDVLTVNIKNPLPKISMFNNKPKPKPNPEPEQEEVNYSSDIPVQKTPARESGPVFDGRVRSDVDMNIPFAEEDNSNTFAVIIANENYKRETKVDYAHNDGEIFRQYCLQTLGLPKSNVHCVKDATLNDFRAEMDWLSQVSNAYNGDARLIVYYAGHGVPDEKTRASYLLPVDGYGSNVNTGYKLSEMYASLSTYPAKSVMVFLDACFSGSERGGGMLASARGVAIKPKQDSPQGNMIVISAASGDETAYKYEEKAHGMFTYFLLKKLQQSGADTTLGDLADYITTNVGRRSIVVNMKSQTPTVSVSTSLASGWRGITFNER